MAEFAGTATVFLLLLFGIMEMALAVNAYNNVCTAAREAARYAIVHSPTSAVPESNSTIAGIAVNYAPFLTTSDVTISFPSDAEIPSQKDALIQITHTYRLHVPFMSAVNLHLSASSRMLVSQ
ncbi:MAG: TadE/TadG family type IV pilus assembly protein [Candidatus Binatus sp.]